MTILIKGIEADGSVALKQSLDISETEMNAMMANLQLDPASINPLELADAILVHQSNPGSMMTRIGLFARDAADLEAVRISYKAA